MAYFGLQLAHLINHLPLDELTFLDKLAALSFESLYLLRVHELGLLLLALLLEHGVLELGLRAFILILRVANFTRELVALPLPDFD